MFFLVSGSAIEPSVGECASGMIKTWHGNGSVGKVLEVLRGPLAVVRYTSVPMLVTRCCATFGFDRQKKHSCGVGGRR